MKYHTKCDWNCSCWHVLGVLLWTAAVISLVYAWVATKNGAILELEANFWFGNALILGILAIPLKLKGGSCECDGCGGGVCVPSQTTGKRKNGNK